VQDHRFAGFRIGPLAEPTEIDLGFLTWWRIIPAHSDARAVAVGVWKRGQRVAAE
jgi:hypothetical protein